MQKKMYCPPVTHITHISSITQYFHTFFTFLLFTFLTLYFIEVAMREKQEWAQCEHIVTSLLLSYRDKKRGTQNFVLKNTTNTGNAFLVWKSGIQTVQTEIETENWDCCSSRVNSSESQWIPMTGCILSTLWNYGVNEIHFLWFVIRDLYDKILTHRTSFRTEYMYLRHICDGNQRNAQRAALSSFMTRDERYEQFTACMLRVSDCLALCPCLCAFPLFPRKSNIGQDTN